MNNAPLDALAELSNSSGVWPHVPSGGAALVGGAPGVLVTVTSLAGEGSFSFGGRSADMHSTLNGAGSHDCWDESDSIPVPVGNQGIRPLSRQRERPGIAGCGAFISRSSGC